MTTLVLHIHFRDYNRRLPQWVLRALSLLANLICMPDPLINEKKSMKNSITNHSIRSLHQQSGSDVMTSSTNSNGDNRGGSEMEDINKALWEVVKEVKRLRKMNEDYDIMKEECTRASRVFDRLMLYFYIIVTGVPTFLMVCVLPMALSGTHTHH